MNASVGCDAPDPAAFADYPASWYYVCTAKSLLPGRLTRAVIGGRPLVLFRSTQGELGALAAWCPHLGTDLSSGRVVDATIECPNHRFRFLSSGACVTQDLRAKAYPVAESCGALFVFLGSKPLFPMPAFPADVELISAKPMQWEVSTNWYMLVANPFDSRHFAGTHDRRLVRAAILRSTNPFALPLEIDYEITGDNLTDRATRLISGSNVRLDITAWGGNLILVRAAFAQDQSFGILVVEPRYDFSRDAPSGALVTVIVSASRRGSSSFAGIRGALTLAAKRFAIKRFLTRDATGVERLQYVAGGLLPGDETLAQFLRWAASMPRAEP